jgi:DNA-binding MarR family transcriptional regulator
MNFDPTLPWNTMLGGGLGFLLTQARNVVLADIERGLAPLNLTAAQFMVIIGIAHERARTLTEFSNYLGYDSGAMKRLLDRVEEKGMIRRVRSLEDRRSQRLELTDEGRALYPRIMETVNAVHARTLAGFTDEEALQFQGFLQRVLAANAA